MSYKLIVLVIVLMSLGQGTSFGADKPMNSSEQEFCRLDKNNNREISLDEFAACEFYKLEHVRALPLLELKDLKRDNNGNVSDEDLKAYLFKKADRNKNGKIDRKE